MRTKFTKEQKQELVNRYISGKSVKSITADTNVARSTLYLWINAYKNAGPTIVSTLREFKEYQRKTKYLTEIINILQVAPCAAQAPLREKLSAIEELSSKYHVHTLCKALKVAKGTYYNHIFRNKRENSQYNLKCEELKSIIHDIFDENHQILGERAK